VLVASAAALGGANAGCHDLVVHTFVGQQYDPSGQCLLPKSVIDVIEGEAHGTCEGVRCYAADDGTVYVSAACEAPPGYVDETDDRYDRQCRLALELYDLGPDGACPTA
jgi:hypothetical protein